MGYIAFISCILLGAALGWAIARHPHARSLGRRLLRRTRYIRPFTPKE